MEVYVLKISHDLGIPWVNGKVIYNAPFIAACVLHGIPNLRSAVGFFVACFGG